ncbi:VCBS repeat-containing protein [Micromonospora sp. C51]|uniref:DNRLRE domain-containing protein n=1 Tax=Micromonospora sp. C51 TaxID=2824879 RepID=UPI001B3939F2|nr:DNRLRE domain-containing protein [Micromonospora sp. C51]MBQ1052382.1 VCBS repeat-containing protein [Micromonospora sp. C51]
MTAPRLLSPFMRTRTRLICTMGLLLVAVIAASLPWWPGIDGGDSRPGVVTEAAPASKPPLDEATAMAEALRTGTEVLVETATTATSLTWALPAGQWRTTTHAIPQRARNATGQWAPIDLTLTHDADAPDGLGVRPVNPPTPVRFFGGATRPDATPSTSPSVQAMRLVARTEVDTPLAEVEIDGHTVTYLWPGELPEPVLDGPRLLYPEVRPGVDLLVVARDEGGFGQLLIVKNRDSATIEAVRSLTYVLRSPTAIFRHDQETGSVQILDAASQVEIASMPTPFAWDSAGQDPTSPQPALRTAVATTADVLNLSGLNGVEAGARHAPMPISLDGDGSGDVRLHLDVAATGLLADADAMFPLFLDPTLRSGTLAWATVYKQHPSTNTWNGTNFNSGSTDARVGYEERTPLTARSFWRMGFKSSMKGATVESATFKVFNNHSWNCTARQMEVWRTGSISSATTWKKQPSWVEVQQKKSFAFGYGSSCADDYVSFDVKKIAQNGADGGWSNVTLGMRATSEGDTLTWRRFKVSSTELTVVYNTPPREPTDGESVPGGDCVPGPGGGVTIARTNLELRAKASDPDNNLKALRFRFWKTGSTVPSGTVVTADSNGIGKLQVPSSSLEDKATYSWDVRAEDHSDATSSYFPPGTDPCRLTIDASAPPAPTVTSDVFPRATPDGATWATVHFGETGAVSFSAAGATQFSYSFESQDTRYVPAVNGAAVVPDLKPRHAGPTTLLVYAYDAVGNRSARTDYAIYVPPRAAGDGPGDTGGDGIPDLILVDNEGKLRTYAGDREPEGTGPNNGELYGWLYSSYDSAGALNPPGHWWNPTTGQAALITKHSDAYPGDGITDLFARTPDGGFWLYPGDGYGSFNVDHRLRVMLPANAPNPSTWTQIKAVGDITGDKRPDLALRSGPEFWVLSGYTGAAFAEATLMNHDAWARRDVVNIIDIDIDGTPDLLWRNLDNGNMYVRHGLPGAVSGSVSLDSLKLANNSRDGDVRYGTSWTEAAIGVVISIPDVNRDGVPDMWVRYESNGNMHIYHPSKTDTGQSKKVVLSADWRLYRAFG